MIKKLISGAVIAGLITFVWNVVSWAVLPWHAVTYRGFEDESVVVRAIQQNARSEGMYAAPYAKPIPEGMHVDEARAIQASVREKLRTGPIVLVSIQPQRRSSFVTPFILALGIQVRAGWMITWLLLHARMARFWPRVCFVVVAALAGAVLGHLPNWNWWGFSDAYTLSEVAGIAEGWLLAGLALAGIVGPQGASA